MITPLKDDIGDWCNEVVILVLQWLTNSLFFTLYI